MPSLWKRFNCRWELGYQVSLSPIEIARGFSALAANYVNEASTVGEMVGEMVGQTMVRYDGEIFGGSAVVSQGPGQVIDGKADEE